MADEFRNVFGAAVAHQPQPRFGVEHDRGLATVLEPQPHDQIRLPVVSAADFRADDDRACCRFALQRGGSMKTMSLPSRQSRWTAQEDVQIPALQFFERRVGVFVRHHPLDQLGKGLIGFRT